MGKNGALRLEAQESFEEGATIIWLPDGGIRISVAEEQAVDSYNHTFECSLTASPEQALELYRWLGAKLAPA